MIEMNAEHIGLYSEDPLNLSKWYVDTLGFSVVRTLEKEGRPPIFFLRGESGLVIEILPTDAPRVNRDLNSPGYSHIGLAVNDFDQASSSLTAQGISLYNVRKTSNGWTIGYMNDPEGNLLELVYRPQ
jgi:catechol 2,3-dioxygenase-like lactoylglutathione lyase family enzyme